MPTNDDQASAATFAGRGLLTVTEAAHWLHFSRNTVYRLIYAGEIPTITLGLHVRRIRVSDLEAWAERNAQSYRPGEWVSVPGRMGSASASGAGADPASGQPCLPTSLLRGGMRHD